MKKILLSLLLVSGVNNSFAMQAGAMQSLGSAAQGGAAGSASASTADDNLSSVDKALFSAVRRGDLVAVRAQLAEGADVNAQNTYKDTALMIAARRGHVEIVRALIRARAYVDAQADFHETALMLAARNGHVGVVQALLNTSADVNAKDAWGWTVLIDAAQNGHVEVVRALLHAGANVNAQNHHGATALIRAAECGHVGVVQALLHAGADVNVKSSENKTAIDYACCNPEIYVPLVEARKASQAAQAAAAKDQGKTAAGDGAASQPAVNPKLCTAVAAKILKDDDTQTDYKLLCNALTQTDELVQIPLSRAQKRSASSLVSESGSAFSRPEKGTSAEQPSCEIMRPIARHSQVCDLPSMQHAMTWSQPIFGLAGTQPAMAMAVAPQIPLQNLITLARRNGTGLFGLIELLNNSAPLANFNAHQAALLFTFMGFDASVFAQANYAPITGFNLARLFSQNIIAICGQADPEIGLTAEQGALIDELNQRFALYAQSFGN